LFKSRRARGIIAGLLIASLPAVVVATDVFTDVGDGNQFHDNINNIAGAGVTQGSPAGSDTYAPANVVTRGQMAAFLNRNGTRAAYSGNGADTPLAATVATELGSLDITPGSAAADTTNFVKADASFTVACTAATDGTCTVLVWLTDGTNLSRLATLTIAEGESENGSLTWAVEAPVTTPGTATTISLIAEMATDDSGSAAGEATAISVPYGADGGNTLAPAP
jgi:hypothetical protein